MDQLRPRLEADLAGQYVFERELGGGGMSRTYLVRELALKVCGYLDRDRPAPGPVEYLVLGHLDRSRGLKAINAARVTAMIR